MGELIKDQINFVWHSFLSGDSKAFNTIYRHYSRQLLTYGYRFSIDREIVNDAMQDVFVDLFMKRSKANVEIGNLKSYLFVALKNNLLKKIAKEKKYSFQPLNENNNDIDFQADYCFQDKWIKEEITEELKERLKQAIDHLSPKQKEIIYLKFEEEMDYPGIANILGISIESARKQLYRALKSLRESSEHKIVNQYIYFLLKKSMK